MTGQQYLANRALELLECATECDRAAAQLLDMVLVLTYLAELPEDMAMRVRLFPDAMKLQA